MDKLSEEDIDIIEEDDNEDDEVTIELKGDELEQGENSTSRLEDKAAVAQPQA